MPSQRIIIQGISGITQFQKTLLEERYTKIVEDFHRRCIVYAIIFHTFRFIVTVGSLLVPALLSVDFTGSNAAQETKTTIYWTTWSLSVAVTTCNGIMTLFKIDKKYYFLHTTYEQLVSEGWQFFQLTGRYSGQLTKHSNEPPTHSNQLVHFCSNIEKIKMKQVEEEYYKLTDNATNTPTKTHHTTDNTHKNGDAPIPSIMDSLYPPTPDMYGLNNKNISKEAMSTVQSILTAMQAAGPPDKKKPAGFPNIVHAMQAVQQQHQQQQQQPLTASGSMNDFQKMPNLTVDTRLPDKQQQQQNQQKSSNNSPTNAFKQHLSIVMEE